MISPLWSARRPVANHLGVPGYSVQDVARLRSEGSVAILLDVRETRELTLASLGPDVVHSPLSELAARGVAALPDVVTAYPGAEIIVLCHHGVRSAQVAAWLVANGFAKAVNMDGGIAAYAAEVDPTVGIY